MEATRRGHLAAIASSHAILFALTTSLFAGDDVRPAIPPALARQVQIVVTSLPAEPAAGASLQECPVPAAEPAEPAEPAGPAGTGGRAAAPPPTAGAPERKIRVDGDPSDWTGIPAQEVRGEGHLWLGQGMAREGWRGDDDLSYSFRAARFGDRLSFLFDVRDDRVLEAAAPKSFLCDCVEVYLDPAGRGGRRVEVLDGRKDWFEKCDRREIRGWELHFLPADPPRVYLDHAHKYDVDRPQTEEFKREWKGEAAARRTAGGYILEAAFAVPGLSLEPGKVLGLETGVCDDDGEGRKAILMWTGTKADFWVDMDGWGKLKIEAK